MATFACSNEDVELVLGAASPASLFGANENRAKIRYRRLAKSVHPDANGNSLESVEAMARLNALWDEYNGRAKKSTERTVTEVTRNDRYAVFDEDGRWLVVERSTSSSMRDAGHGESLGKVLDGSPVCVLRCVGTKLIAQPDGTHAAYVCDMPEYAQDLVPLTSLRDVLPSGKLHPADLAWISKRVLFLSGALDVCGLGLASFGTCAGISPKGHMLCVMTPWELESTDGALSRTVVRNFTNVLTDMIADDAKSERIRSFLYGTTIDNATGWDRIMREYDDMLFDLFGPPRFHVMEVRR
jgi:hypothetical protein